MVKFLGIFILILAGIDLSTVLGAIAVNAKEFNLIQIKYYYRNNEEIRREIQKLAYNLVTDLLVVIYMILTLF